MHLLAAKLDKLEKTKLVVTNYGDSDKKKIIYKNLFNINDYKDEQYVKEPVVYTLDEPYCASYLKYKDSFKEPIVPEPILSEKSKSLTVFTNNGKPQYPDIWENYKTQLKLNWEVEDIQLSKDIDDWNKLDEKEQTFLLYVLAFFASFDGLVNANIDENLIKIITIKEADTAYAKQREMENVHNEMYAKMISIFVTNEDLQMYP